MKAIYRIVITMTIMLLSYQSFADNTSDVDNQNCKFTHSNDISCDEMIDLFCARLTTTSNAQQRELIEEDFGDCDCNARFTDQAKWYVILNGRQGRFMCAQKQALNPLLQSELRILNQDSL